MCEGRAGWGAVTLSFARRTHAEWSINAVIHHTVATLPAAQVSVDALLTVHALVHLLVELIDETLARVGVWRRTNGACTAEQARIRRACIYKNISERGFCCV